MAIFDKPVFLKFSIVMVPLCHHVTCGMWFSWQVKRALSKSRSNVGVCFLSVGYPTQNCNSHWSYCHQFDLMLTLPKEKHFFPLWFSFPLCTNTCVYIITSVHVHQFYQTELIQEELLVLYGWVTFSWINSTSWRSLCISAPNTKVCSLTFYCQ